jgi:acyl phosphate:glycerol-3-phosphate acyltransferase
MHWTIYVIIGYLAGSIPFGLLLTRWAGMGDVRQVGSGNIGATNVLRMGNKKIAALTLLCDGLKGFAPVLLASYQMDSTGIMVAGFAAMAGHVFPVWLGFKGGKGVATGLGVMFGWAWPVGVACIALWLVVFMMTRISSASALAASALTIPVAYFLVTPLVAGQVAGLTAIIWVMHHANIRRLLKGEEPKSSFSKQA